MVYLSSGMKIWQDQHLQSGPLLDINWGGFPYKWASNMGFTELFPLISGSYGTQTCVTQGTVPSGSSSQPSSRINEAAAAWLELLVCAVYSWKGSHNPILGKQQLTIWLVASTPLKNISQNGNLPQKGVKTKDIWNDHPGRGFFSLKGYKITFLKRRTSLI